MALGPKQQKKAENQIYRAKLSSLGLLQDSAGQAEELLIAQQQAHDCLDAVCHAGSLQHAGHCTLGILLHLRYIITALRILIIMIIITIMIINKKKVPHACQLLRNQHG